jgi:hypothetical protein
MIKLFLEFNEPHDDSDRNLSENDFMVDRSNNNNNNINNNNINEKIGSSKEEGRGNDEQSKGDDRKNGANKEEERESNKRSREELDRPNKRSQEEDLSRNGNKDHQDRTGSVRNIRPNKYTDESKRESTHNKYK